MSSTANAQITCPTCGQAFNLSYWASVNVTLHPGFRERVFDGAIHEHSCPHCGQVIVIQSRLLYHDASRRFMVFFQEEHAGRPITWETQFLADTATALSQYQLRFVTTWNDLLEKVIVFENGWDDTVIEMLKLVLTEKVYPFGTPEYLRCTVLTVGRRTIPTGPVLTFEFSLDGAHVAHLHAPFEVYEGLAAGQCARFGKNSGAGEWKMVNKATLLESYE